jgi:hypothetical protein
MCYLAQAASAITAVDMQHLGMELREAALTLGARLCDRVGVRSQEAIALAERSERGLDLRANVAAMLAWHTGEEHRAYVARFSWRTG